MFRLIALIFLLPLPISSFAEDACSYCKDLHEWMGESLKIKPDPLNPETIAEQNPVLEKGEALLDSAFKGIQNTTKNERIAHIKNLVKILVIVAPYDPSHVFLQPHVQNIKPILKDVKEQLLRFQRVGDALIKSEQTLRTGTGDVLGITSEQRKGVLTAITTNLNYEKAAEKKRRSEASSKPRP